MSFPEVISQTEWQRAHERLLAQEKEHTRQADALAAQRRRLPVAPVEQEYEFEGPNGSVKLIDLFAGRRQLIVYHFMFAPGVEGWPSAGCPGCSMFVDQIGELAHFHARGTSLVLISRAPLVLISRAPLVSLEAYRERIGWTIPWFLSQDSSFNGDFGLTRVDSEHFGLSVFIRDDDDRVYRSYFTSGRGVEALGSVWSFLDLTPLGRQETWEESPSGRLQSPPYEWWRRHDEYDFRADEAAVPGARR